MPETLTAPTSRQRPDPIAKIAAPSPDAGPRPRRFIALALGSALVCASLVTGLNFVVDPRNAFPPDHFRPLREDTYDRLLVEWESMDPGTDPPVVVFGPSTAVAMRREGTLNLAAPGSGPGDYLAVYDYMVRLGRPPEKIVVSLDDFLFLDVYWNKDLLPGSAAHDRVTGRSVPASYVAEELWASFNPGYFLGTLRVLMFTYFTGYPPLVDNRTLVEVPAEGLTELVAPDVRVLFDAYQPDMRFDAGKAKALETLIDHARANGTEVHLVLPPIHPDVLRILEEKPDYDRIHGRAVEFGLASCAPGVRLHDFVRLGSFGGNATAFKDGWHYMVENGEQLLDAIDSDFGACPEAEAK